MTGYQSNPTPESYWNIRIPRYHTPLVSEGVPGINYFVLGRKRDFNNIIIRLFLTPPGRAGCSGVMSLTCVDIFVTVTGISNFFL